MRIVVTSGAGPDEPSRSWLAVFDGTTVATLATDPSGRITYCNPAAAAVFGASSGELLGALARDLLFEEADRGAVEEITSQVVRGSAWAGELQMVCAGGRVRSVATSWAPMPSGERFGGLLLVVEGAGPETGPGSAGDGRESAHARVLTRRLDRLGSISADLLASTTIDEVAAVVTEHMTDAAGATVGSISLLVDDETLALIAIRGGAEGVASRWATYPLSGNTPAAECVRTRKPILLGGLAEIRSRYPDLESAAEGERAVACFPLRAGVRSLGAVSLSFPGRRPVDAAEMLFLQLLSDMCAHAIDRIQAQASAADREAKLSFIADASARLAGDLDYESTLTAVAEAAVPWFADWCAIALEEDGRLRNIAVAHAQPEHAHLVEELQTRYPARPTGTQGSYQILRTGVSELVPEISDDLLARVSQDEEHLRLLSTLAFRSALACPLKVRDRVLGVITWVAGESGRRFSGDDLAFGEDLARRAAVAIDNAQLHSETRDVALRLQHAVLPERLPELPGWETAVVYLPAGRTDAGGDFYDVVDLGAGRLATFVGDVMGRGVEAASVMTQMRSAIRTLVALDPEPLAVMTGLDQVFDRLDLEHLVTVAYAVVDDAAGMVHSINAGHPAPLLIRRSGEVEVVTHASTMLLGAGGGERDLVSLPLGPGDTVLLYTDGLVERRGEDTDAGMSRLVRACRELDRADLGAFLENTVDVVRDPTRDDDVAALAIRRRG
jgi:PAS domain S-box-containing protein